MVDCGSLEINQNLIKKTFTIDHTIKNYSYFGNRAGTCLVSEQYDIGNKDITLVMVITPGSPLDVKLHRVAQKAEEVDVYNCFASIVGAEGVLKEKVYMKPTTFTKRRTENEYKMMEFINGGINTSAKNVYFSDYLVDGTLTIRVSGCAFYHKSGDVTLAKDLHPMVNNMNSGCDVTLMIGEDEIVAHSLILKARSSVFRDMFSGQNIENNERTITIENEDSDVFLEFLHFLYTDESPNISKMVYDLLRLADKYNVSGLKSLCEYELVKSVTVENACDYWSQSCVTNASDARKGVGKFIRENLKAVVNSEGWNNFKAAIEPVGDIVEMIANEQTE